LRTARAHCRESSVARRIDEGDLLTILLDLVGADMLGDSARLARLDIGMADGVEQRGLAVVDMAHDGDDRRAADQILFAIGNVEKTLFDVGLGNTLDGVAEFRCDQFGRIGVDDVAGLHHLPLLHEELDDIDRAFRHALGQFLDGDRLRNGDFAHDLLAGLAVHRPLELLLPPAHRGDRARAGIAVLGRKRGSERQLATAPVRLATRTHGTGHFRSRDATRRSRSATAASRSLFLVVSSDIRRLGSAPARLFLGTAAGLRLLLQACLFLGLTARGFLTLAPTALFFLGTATSLFSGALTILYLARLGALESAATRFHLFA